MAVVASVEAMHYMKTKQPIMLSVQELIDCVSENHGCNGGYSQPTLKYIRKNGLSSESSYRYMESQSSCRKGNKAVDAMISGFNNVSTTEEALEEAVAKKPVIIHLKWPPSMNSYKGGIIEYEYLPPTLPDGTVLRWHYALIVGYGTDSNGVEYWRIKNSWGETWGEGGYFRIRRHVADERGVLGMFTYPAEYPIA
jgi:C1A family cysteine protease